MTGELASALVVEGYNGSTREVALTGKRTVVSDWTPIEAGAAIDAYDVKISFPDHDGGEVLFGSDNKDNQYQGKEATIQIFYEAVQANAKLDATLEGINSKLATEEIVDGEMNHTMYDALQDLSDAQVTAIRERDYVWSQELDEFFAFTSEPTDAYKYFKMYGSAEAVSGNYSIYAAASTWDATVNLVGKGFDAGDATGITEINYTNTDEARDVVIRTNSAETSLEVNDGTTGTIYHYGTAGALNIIQCHTESYHENGNIAFAEIAKGRIVLEKGSDINHIHVNPKSTKDAFDEVIIKDNGAAALPEKITRGQVKVSEAKPVVTVETATASETVYVYPYTDSTSTETGTTEKKTGEVKQNEHVNTALGKLVLDNGNDAGEKAMSDNDKEEAKTGATLFAGGKGTQENPYLIKTAQHWNNFYQAVYDFNKENKVAYFELANDIDLSGAEITNYAVDGETIKYNHYMNFVLDGKDKKLSGIETLKGYGQLFPYLKNSTIKNITIDYKIVNSTRTIAMAYDAVGECYFTDVTTTGEISTSANWATAFVAYSVGSNNIYYTNCTNKANIKGGFGNNAYIAAFGSHNGGGVHITFDNCKNYGVLLGGHVGFVGMGNDSAYTFVDDNAVQNYGTMTGTKDAGYFNYSSSAESKKIGGVTCVVKKEGASVNKSTTHTNSAPVNFGDAIVLNAVEGAVKYEVEMSFSIQVYNYDDTSNANKWSGGFPRSMALSYTADDVENGKITTAFKKGYVGEVKADQYYGYRNTTPSYDNGVFVPAGFDISKANIVLNQGDIYLVEDNGAYYYVFYSEQYHGWYSLLTTDTDGNVKSTQVTVSFSVTAYNPDGSVLSFSSFSYASPVEDAKNFFATL